MGKPNIRRNTWLFLAAIALCGALHMVDFYCPRFVASNLFVLYNTIYLTLVLFWLDSVRWRLLPSRSRQYMILLGLMMLLYLLEKTYRFRASFQFPLFARLAWYAYYIPLPFMMTLFWMSCLCLSRSAGEQGGRERLLLIPAGLLALGILTNDLHQLAYRSLIDLSEQVGSSGTYTRGPLFWAAYAWMGLCLVMGLVALLRASQRLHNWHLALYPMLFIPLWGLLLLQDLVFKDRFRSAFFLMPEITVFCLIGFCEVCIRERLMPYNENYDGFFAAMRLPVLITDRDFSPVYSSAVGLDADRSQLERSLEGPVYPREGIRLHGRQIRAGYAFWTVDERELARQEREIAASNRALEAENDLIRAEAAMREDQERLALRSGLLQQVSRELSPTLAEIQSILDSAQPDAPDLREKILRVALLGVYAKRKSDLMLKSMEQEELESRTLMLAIDELLRYQRYLGIEASLRDTLERPLPSRDAVALFDSYSALSAALLPDTHHLVVALNETGLRLCTDAPRPRVLPQTPLPVELLEAEGLLYLTIRTGKGGAG